MSLFLGFGGILVSTVLGTLIVAAIWPVQNAARSPWVLRVALGLGLGLFVTSVLFVGWSRVTPRPGWPTFLNELTLVAGGAFALARRYRQRSAPAASIVRAPWSHGAVLALGAIAAAAIPALLATGRALQAEPLGGWDAWAIWNLHARFLFRAGQAWPELLNAPAMAWTHADYPLLLPGSIARLWTYTGGETVNAPAIVAAVLALGTLLIVATTLWRQRGPLVAALAALTLLATPFFVTFALNQHADIPLGYFFASTLALLILAGDRADAARCRCLAGLMAAGAAWTKNEGLLFAAATALVVLADATIRRTPRAALGFLVGLLGGFVPVLAFKFGQTPGNDIVSGELVHRLSQLLEPERYRVIAAAAWRDFGRFGEWHIVPFAALAILLSPARIRTAARAVRYLVVILGLMLAGYAAIYLLTPWNLQEHLDSSLVRLLLQLWPATLLLWGLLVSDRLASPAWQAQAPTRVSLAVALALAVGSALTVWSYARTQLPLGEFAAVRTAGATYHFVPKEGWHSIEQAGQERWVWSRQSATLVVDLDSAVQPRAFTFRLRSLEARNVTVRLDGREIWRGDVGTAWTPVTLPFPALSSGPHDLTFELPQSGVREGTSPGARVLGLAITPPRQVHR